MGFELFLDEDTSSRRLVRMSTEAGHDVVTVLEEGLQGSPDPNVLLRARELRRVLVTQNVGDFRELHEEDAEQPGILGIFHERDRSRGHRAWSSAAGFIR